MKLIPLSQGLFTQVDDEDFEALNQYEWFAITGEGGTYAKRNITTPEGKQTTVRMHNVILGRVGVDHRDRNGLNNQRSNLRPATHRNNCRNRGKRSGCTSSYKGVSLYPSTGKWKAQITLDRVTHLGYFVEEIEAAKAYDAVARNHFGEFAVLNFPD